MKRTTILLCVCLFLPLANVSAWNDTGHMIVAQLAWRALSSGERARISTLLRAHPHYEELLNQDIPAGVNPEEWIFMRAATWPDMVRPASPGQPPKPARITASHR